jgi:hypothetical protein
VTQQFGLQLLWSQVSGTTLSNRVGISSMSYKKQKTAQGPQQALQEQQQQQQHQQQQQQQQHHQAAQGFKSLGLQLHPASKVISYVYIKRQKGQDGDASLANALYVTGLPLGLDEAALQTIFELFGEVLDVVVHPSKVSRWSSSIWAAWITCQLHACCALKLAWSQWASQPASQPAGQQLV